MTRLPLAFWRWVYLAVWVAAAACAMLAIGQWWSTGYATERLAVLSARAGGEVATDDESVASNSDDGDTGEERNAGSKEPTTTTALPDDDLGLVAAQRILDHYLARHQPPERFREVRGVLGNKALFTHGGAVGVGESFDGATVKAVGANWVEVEHDGETIKLFVTGGQEQPRSARPRRPRRARPDVQNEPAVVAINENDAPGATGRRRITRDDIDPAKIAAKYGIPVAMVEQQLAQVSDEEFEEGIEELGDEVEEFLKD